MHLIQKPHFSEILSSYGLYTAFKIRYLIDRERVRKNDHIWQIVGNHEKRHMTQYRLIRYYGISAGQIGRLKKNMYVSTHTLEVFCQILDCRIEDIVEYIPDKPEGE